MMESATVYVLTSLAIDAKGNVTSRNVGVTFSLHEAEAHRGDGVESEFEVFTVPARWRDDAEQTNLIVAMREFRGMVREMQEEALR